MTASAKSYYEFEVELETETNFDIYKYSTSIGTPYTSF